MIAARHTGAWTVERVYDAFPRLAERRSNGGGQLSGGEQQMLAIARALVTNPQLLIMDEPTEGLAPVIVSQLEEMLARLGAEGDIAILVIEQNIGVATSVSDRVAIMVNGRINRIIEFEPPRRRPRSSAAPARRRPAFGGGAGAGVAGAGAGDAQIGPVPAAVGRGADQDLRLQSCSADPLVAAGPERPDRGRRPHRLGRRRPDRGRRRAPRAGARGAFAGPSDRSRCRYARHQGAGTALHPRSGGGERSAGPGSSTSRPAASSPPATSPRRRSR